MKSTNNSIFQKYYSPQKFIDRYTKDKKNAVDVIIPLMHTNELWKQNLLSIYREVPVNRLLIGDGGCIDNSLTIARKFPRVTVLDHRKYKSLGYSIRKLIEAVETSWFIYLHSDVYLPKGWFNKMKKHQKEYDWFECRQHVTALVEYPLNYEGVSRSYSGSQMGRKKAFVRFLSDIEDDYLYRNEDIILSTLLEESGFRYGRVDDTFHYHQTMNKQSQWKRQIKSVSFEIEKGRQEEIREHSTQVKGFVKYLQPTQSLVPYILQSLLRLEELSEFNYRQFYDWVKSTNPLWNKLFPLPNNFSRLQVTRRPFLVRLRIFLNALYALLFG